MPIKYRGVLNNGNEALNTGKTITANEIVETVDEKALAREIHHLNGLIPEQVAESVLQNFCQAAAHLNRRAYGFEIKKDFFKLSQEKIMPLARGARQTNIFENPDV